MNEETRNLLALLAGLNKTMGDAYLKLTGSMTNGELDPAQLRYLALIFDDMSTLLTKHADQVDPLSTDRPPTVVDGATDTQEGTTEGVSMTAPMTTLATGGSLISEGLFNRLVVRIVQDHDRHREEAARIVDQTLSFLAACAANPSLKLGPSEQVDIGWHTFILHTRDYRDFCARFASGQFIDHVPTDANTVRGPEARRILVRTVDAIRDAGYVVDEELWPEVASCSQCHQGCTDSP